MTNLSLISTQRPVAFKVHVSPEIGDADLRILCATDLWGHSDHALQKALWLAETTDAELLLLHVVDGEMPLRLTGRRADQARSALAWQVRRWPTFKPRPAISVRVGNPRRTISRVAREWRADLVVLGSSRSVNGFLPTTAERVASEADCAVLAINCTAPEAYPNATIVAESCCRATALEHALVKFQILKIGAKPKKIFPLDSAPLGSAKKRSRAVGVPDCARGHSYGRRMRMDALVADATEGALRAPPDLVMVEADRWPMLTGLFRRSAASVVARSMATDLLITPHRKMPPGSSIRCSRHLSAVGSSAR